MKFNILTFGLCSLGLLTASCADSFLDTASVTEQTTGNFYKTELDANRALLGCYDGWRQTNSAPGIGLVVASLVMSDECFGAAGQGDGRNYQVIDRFNTTESPADTKIYTQDWAVYYAAVYRCNELIAHEDQIAWSETSGNHGLWMGECRAIRAMCYFDMVRFWGNIPLYSAPENVNKEQADPDEVYALIFDDLKYAIENIPVDAYPKSMAASNDGRITKYAAEAILARAYLYYTGYYGKEPEGVTKQMALDACEDVIANSGCSLVADFKTLWPAASLVPVIGELAWDNQLSTYAGEANSEVVLNMKFTPSQDYNGNNDSNRWQVMLGVRGVNKSPYGKGWGGCSVTPAMLAMFEDGDLRKEASVIDIAGEGFEAVDGYEKSCYLDSREFTGYAVKKYSPLAYYDGTSANREDGSGDFMINGQQDYVIVRLADVMLMAAELGSSSAAQYMHQIRSRAGLGDVPVTKENILHERAVELAFEGHRYWDLLRQGIDYAASAIAASSANTLTAGKTDKVVIDAAKVKATMGLSQIPADQIIQAGGSLKQNAGW